MYEQNGPIKIPQATHIFRDIYVYQGVQNPLHRRRRTATTCEHNGVDDGLRELTWPVQRSSSSTSRGVIKSRDLREAKTICTAAALMMVFGKLGGAGAESCVGFGVCEMTGETGPVVRGIPDEVNREVTVRPVQHAARCRRWKVSILR